MKGKRNARGTQIVVQVGPQQNRSSVLVAVMKMLFQQETKLSTVKSFLAVESGVPVHHLKQGAKPSAEPSAGPCDDLHPAREE